LIQSLAFHLALMEGLLHLEVTILLLSYGRL
jgi:hypothetical protein